MKDALGIGFQELYERYAADVHRFAYWLSGDADTAKDITSETFVRAWMADSIVESGSIKAYLLTIARNLYLHELRRTRRRGAMPEDVAEEAPGLERRVAGQLAMDDVRKALLQLSEIDRTVLLLRADEGLSYDEIARTTGLSIAAAKVRMFRARARLSSLVPHIRMEQS